MKKAVVALSGGVDSATALATAWDEGVRVVAAVGFCYGSKHNPHENEAARKVAGYYDTPFELIDLTGAFAGFKSALLATGDKLPEGHYEAESMRQTVVPCRNVIFSAILAGVAESRGADEVWLGIHAGDHFIYPDCRPVFFHAMRSAIKFATDDKVLLKAPFLNFPKREIIGLGKDLNVPYNLTRTCYSDRAVACGKCGSCQERLESFAYHGLNDPIEYETRELMAKAVSD